MHWLGRQCSQRRQIIERIAFAIRQAKARREAQHVHGADMLPVSRDDGHAGIEAHAAATAEEGRAVEAAILGDVRHDQQLGVLHCQLAERENMIRFRQAAPRDAAMPPPIGVDKTYGCDGGIQHPAGNGGQRVCKGACVGSHNGRYVQCAQTVKVGRVAAQSVASAYYGRRNVDSPHPSGIPTTPSSHNTGRRAERHFIIE